MGKNSKPSGLQIKRSGSSFVFSWKKAGSNWSNQQVQYKLSTQSSWATLSVGKNTTSKSISVNFNNYYPFTKTKLTSVSFRVRGKDGSDHTSWVTCTLKLLPPSTPSLTATLDTDLQNKTNFSWAADNNTSSARVFARCYWKTALATDFNSNDGSKAKYGGLGNTGASGSYGAVEDNSVISDGKSHTRWVAVIARGCAGDSGWVYAKHVYAQSKQAFNVTARTKTDNGFLCEVEYQTEQSSSRPIDSIEVQYTVTSPDRGLECPSGSSWSTGAKVAYKDGTDRASFYIDDSLSEDECLFVRVNTKHDGDTNTVYGIPVLADSGRIASPTIDSVTTYDSSHTAYIEATNNSQIADSFLAITYQPSSDPSSAYVVGVLPSGYISATVTCPDWTYESGISFGVYAVVGTYEKSTSDSGLPSYNINPYDGKPLMVSDTEWWESGNVPTAPERVSVSETETAETIRVSWVNTWPDSTGAELSWADHIDAWESTDEPSDYTIKNPMVTHWNISGLSAGTWYVRVRLINENGDDTVYSPYSDIVTVVVSKVPVTPTLELSSSVITEEDEITATWVYTSSDGSLQSSAELCEILDPPNLNSEYVASSDTEVNPMTIYYQLVSQNTYEEVVSPTGDPSESGYYQKNRQPIATTASEQHATVNARAQQWSAGETHYLAVKVVYGEDDDSSSWSSVVPLVIAPALECSVTSTSLEVVDVIEDGDQETTLPVLSLTELPLSITVSGAGSDNITSITIERSAPYFANKPDETEFHGYEGEVVVLYSQTGDSTISFGLDDLLTHFDDGAQYRITAQTRDGYGQVATADTIDFEVHWSHQAIMPLAEFEVDQDAHIARIRPIAPRGTESGDVCDIYRLSADKPELIYENAIFGVQYVDPYPTIGNTGGHRIVFKTANGDYITEGNEFAWLDLDVDDGDVLNIDRTIIDFDGEQILLDYNVDFQYQWEKDFLETKYLGGAVQGDWNPAVSRTGTVTGVAITLTDQDMINAMRRLAIFPGICRVRTQDGSNFAADVQVSESRVHDNKRIIASFSLAITKVDPEGYDGIPNDEYIEG